MSGIFGLFNIIALFYVFKGFQVAIKIGREWSSLRQEPLTPAKKQLAETASFFLAVPPAVLVHEFFHALATWAFGGKIVDFGYGVFWGYVVPVGDFSAAQNWFIALAGTLGSLTFGVGIWLLLRRNQFSTFRYFGLRAFRFQIYFALLYYPILSIFITEGSDWRVIYDFQATPILSGLTAVIHLPILFLFWKTDRDGLFEQPAFATVGEQTQFYAVENAATFSPDDAQAQLQYIDALRRGGVSNKANQELKEFLKAHPENGVAHLELAMLLNNKNRAITKEAFTHAQQALTLGINPEAALVAHQLVGQYYLTMGRAMETIGEMDQALAIESKLTISPIQRANLLFLRGQAYRHQSQFMQAQQDIESVTTIAQQIGDNHLLARCENEMTVITKHEKRPFSTPTPVTQY